MTHHPYEAILANEVPEAAIASMAHMTDGDIQAQIDRISALRGSVEYGLLTRMVDQRSDAAELHAYSVELIRRRVMGEQVAEPVNLLDAIRAKIDADNAATNQMLAQIAVIHADTAAMQAVMFPAFDAEGSEHQMGVAAE